VVFGYLISIFKLFQNIAVRIFLNSPVANNQPLYIILLARQHCWLPNIDVYLYIIMIFIYIVFTLEHMFQISIYIYIEFHTYIYKEKVTTIINKYMKYNIYK
jgi:hypothetical protein